MTKANQNQDPDQTATTSSISLRKRAEEQAAMEKTADREPEETELLLHELRVHQIELEMQIEDLRRTQREMEASSARCFDLCDLAPVGYGR